MYLFRFVRFGMEQSPPCVVCGCDPVLFSCVFCECMFFAVLFNTSNNNNKNPVQNSSTHYQHEEGGNFPGGGSGYFPNPIFDLIPKKQSSLDDINFLKAFIKKIPELFKKGNLLQKYVLLKYVMESYESCLKQQEKARDVKKGKKEIGRSATAKLGFDATRDHTSPRRHFLLQEDATTINNYSQQHAASLGNTSNDNDDENNGFRLNPGLIDDNELFALPPMAMVDGGVDDDDDQDNNFVAQYHKDLLQLAEEFKHSMDSLNFHTDIDEEQQSRVSSSLNNAPPINLDSITDDNLLPSMQDLLPKNRQEQQKLTKQTYEVSSKTVEMAEAVKETSRSSQGHYNLRPRRSRIVESLFSESPPPTSSRNRRSTQGRIDKEGAATSTQRNSSLLISSPQRPPRPRPNYLTEEEYSLRLPMPKRKIVPIGPIPKMQSKRVLSELSYYPIDFTITREEYSYERHKRDDFVNLTLPTNTTTTAAEATVGSQTLSSSVIAVSSDDDGNVRSQSLPQSQQQTQQMLQQQQYLSSNISNSLVEVRQAVSDLVDAGVSLQVDNNLSVIGEEGGGRANTSGLHEKSMIQHGIGIADQSDLLIEIPPALPAR